MKIFLKTFTIIILILLVSVAGRSINLNLINKSDESELLKDSEEAFNKFTENYKSDRKTIVVIGPSTSMYSYKNKFSNFETYSYVNILEEHFNVLNLTTLNLNNINEFNTLMEFAYRKTPEADLVVLENLKFFEEKELFEGSTIWPALAACKIGTYSDPFRSKICKDFTKSLVYETSRDKLNNPCMKKYHGEFGSAFILNSNDRVNFFLKLLKCGKNSNSTEEIKNILVENFKYGFLQDVREALTKSGYNIREVENSEAYYSIYRPEELLMIDDKLTYSLQKYPWKKFVIIPSYSRVDTSMQNLPVFTAFRDRVEFIEMHKDIAERSRRQNLMFEDNFVDGAHANVWIHRALAAKIMNLHF